MTTPEIFTGPARNQRWILLENVDSMTLPAHGCVEVVDSYRPEASNPLAPGGGPTVLKVRRPTADGLCNVAIVGHKEIEVEARGAGTMDGPAWVRYGGGNPLPGQIWGSTKNDFALKEGRSGFQILGDPHDLGGQEIVRVRFVEKLARIKATQNALPGVVKQGWLERWSAGGWVDTGTHLEDIQDDLHYVCCVEDEYFMVECYGDKYHTIEPHGLWRHGEPTAPIDPGQTGTVDLKSDSQGCVGSAKMQITGCVLPGWSRAEPGNEVLAIYERGMKGWKFYFCGQGLKYKIEAATCKNAIDAAQGTLYVYSVASGAWVSTGSSIIAWDPEKIVVLLPGERHRVEDVGGGRWEFIGERGLSRRAWVQDGIGCGVAGTVHLLQHNEQDCISETKCPVIACNGEIGAGSVPQEEGRRYLYSGEIVSVTCYEGRWVIDAQPIAMWHIAPLEKKMCVTDIDGDFGGQIPFDYCPGIHSATRFDPGASITADNTFNHAAKVPAVGFLFIFPDGAGGDTGIVVDVSARAHDPVVDDVPAACEDSPQDAGVAIGYEGCKLKTYRQPNTRYESSDDADWFDDLELSPHTNIANTRTYVRSTVGSGSGDDVCELVTEAQLDTFCAFGEQEPHPPWGELHAETLPTQVVYESYQTADGCVLLVKKRIPVLCEGEDVGTDAIICGLPCPTPVSGSGS